MFSVWQRGRRLHQAFMKACILFMTVVPMMQSPPKYYHSRDLISIWILDRHQLSFRSSHLPYHKHWNLSLASNIESLIFSSISSNCYLKWSMSFRLIFYCQYITGKTFTLHIILYSSCLQVNKVRLFRASMISLTFDFTHACHGKLLLD
jgi:hypothetical protein